MLLLKLADNDVCGNLKWIKIGYVIVHKESASKAGVRVHLP